MNVSLNYNINVRPRNTSVTFGPAYGKHMMDVEFDVVTPNALPLSNIETRRLLKDPAVIDYVMRSVLEEYNSKHIEPLELIPDSATTVWMTAWAQSGRLVLRMEFRNLTVEEAVGQIERQMTLSVKAGNGCWSNNGHRNPL